MNKISVGRSGAIKFVARILKNARYGVVVHGSRSCDCKWIEVWSHPFGAKEEMADWLGNLNLTLMGTWFTSNMTGEMRKKILGLIPDELEVVPTPKEVYMAKENDYGWQEEE